MNKPEEQGVTREAAREYLREQLKYSHTDHVHPSNTQAVMEKQHEFIVETVRRESQARKIFMLDVGCGWGDFSNKLGPFVTDYVGVEPSEGELKQFNRHSNRFVVHGIGEDLSFLRTNSRNVILLNSVLDHCVDWRKTFDNCLRVLTPGGLLIISMENSEKLPIMVKKSLGLKANHEGHLAFFPYRGLGDLLDREGFKIERRCTMGYLYGFHQLTMVVPIPLSVMRPVNRAVDVLGNALAPSVGQVLFFAARNNRPSSDSIVCDDPFQCPKCQTVWKFGAPHCSKCGTQMKYLHGEILDALAFTNSEEIITQKFAGKI